MNYDIELVIFASILFGMIISKILDILLEFVLYLKNKNKSNEV